MSNLKELLEEKYGVKIVESKLDKTISNIRKKYDALDDINKKWGDELDKALISYHKDLEKRGYKKSNDYAPDYEASDEEWSEYDEIESELNSKYKIGDINNKYSSEQDKIANSIWSELKSSIKDVPALRPYASTLSNEKHKLEL